MSFFFPCFILSISAVVRTYLYNYTMTPHVKYVSICVQREITLNSGKEISAPQIIQGREFTTRDITRFTYQVMCWREFTISRLFFFFLSFLIIFSLSFPLISLPCFWFFYFSSPPLRGGGKRQNIFPWNSEKNMKKIDFYVWYLKRTALKNVDWQWNRFLKILIFGEVMD